MKKNKKKNFSQNFLIDKNIIKKIISFLDFKNDDLVIEIGPGYGNITKYLLKFLKKIYVIEIDKNLVNFLKKKFFLKKIKIYFLDVLNFNFLNFFNRFKKKIRLIGSLPYNISSLLLFYLIQFSNLLIDQHFILQKEFVDRMIAKPGNKKFGRLSIMLQIHFKIKLLFLINPESFKPKPKVKSAMVRIISKKILIKYNIFFLNKILIKAFSNRRKFIFNCVSNFFSKEDFIFLKINPKLRPEMLTIKQYILLSNFLKKKKN
ncbi:16S rRNA (adenine(1518)-N(6)/adenine(1519)-N(6))-dimethyltransferase RsmA [Candidatus Zinderia endosymbiont of Aphrophora alni]|uniref:16S rRNA (adenine(1518)-N(6)/adenine(1519)-N(6))- dimethyltransferase RsmA n=1 Tax=Candidatus Zinderia endosymbiont of Aphrophora alni TaxID=3077951 RepID=UPI0030CE71CF